MASSTEVLAGLVERVTFHNEENGFCVLRVKARGQRDLITVLGHAAMIAAGEFVQASGTWSMTAPTASSSKPRFLIYACSRYISPFSDLLIWSAILAVMLYPLHLRLAVRLGNRWSGEPRALGCYYASLASSSGPMSSKIPAGTASMSRMPLPGPTQILIGSARGIPAEENNSSAFTGKM